MVSVSWLLWLPLGMDFLLALVTYPMFLINGLSWFMNQHEDDDNGNDSEHTTNKKDDTARKSIPIEELASNVRVQAVWNVLMIAYSGYVALFFLAIYGTYYFPDLFATPTSYSMLFLMIMKLIGTARIHSSNDNSKSRKQHYKEKEYVLYLFYIPTYGGYAVLTTFFGY